MNNKKKYASTFIFIFLINVITINSYGQPIPESAREKYVMGITLRDQAKIVSDYDSPITKFKEAIQLAPSWADAYKELGLTLELAGKFDDAIYYLNKYLTFNPSADDARKAQDEIYIIKAKKEKANSPEALMKRDQDAFADFLRQNEGAIFNTVPRNGKNYSNGMYDQAKIENGVLVIGTITNTESFLIYNPGYRDRLGDSDRYPVTGFISVISIRNSPPISLTFSRDGKTLTREYDTDVWTKGPNDDPKSASQFSQYKGRERVKHVFWRQ